MRESASGNARSEARRLVRRGRESYHSGDTEMSKSIIAALALSTLAVVGFTGVAQAQPKCGLMGTSTHGCIHTPTTPQLPSPKQ
jgi:hypothetical protein